MASVTKKLENAVKALEKGQLKKALYYTDDQKTQKQHDSVERAARTCLTDRNNKEGCKTAMKKARDEVQDTITVPIDDASLEGVEEYLSPEKPQAVEETTPEQTDEELFESCEECHVAAAAIEFAKACDGSEGTICKQISERLEDESTEPAHWIKTMIQTAEKAEGERKEKMVAALTSLTDYLTKRGSDILKQLEKENSKD